MCSDSIHYHFCELIDFNVPVVQFCVANDLAHFFFSHFLAHVDHGVQEFFYGDLAIVVGIKYFQGIDHVLQGIRVLAAGTN